MFHIVMGVPNYMMFCHVLSFCSDRRSRLMFVSQSVLCLSYDLSFGNNSQCLIQFSCCLSVCLFVSKERYLRLLFVICEEAQSVL
jgi:hypothetical protein